VRALPDFPWNSLVPYRERADAHPGGLVDLSVGTPVDPTPAVVRAAVSAGSDAPGYPATHGTVALREAVADYFARRWGLTGIDPEGVLPLLGTKEFVAWLPTLLRLGPSDVVVYPELAYPTYDIGARLAGAEGATSASLGSVDPARLGLVWVNSPGNPDGGVLDSFDLREIVTVGRLFGAVVASDECYLEFGWDATPASVLDPAVNDGSLDGILAVHSLSKRSNMAGYRAGFAVGDVELVRRLVEVRKHAGMMMPAPVQAAMIAALGDDDHVDEQRARYEARRVMLRPALEKAGFRIEHSTGGLYLWATRDEPCWDDVGWMADRGIVVAPGEFYGSAGARHVRVALTATDEHIAAAAERLIT
jgi:succinyldiaminopimelate transaminase